jgi:hypothetical protein
VTAAQFRAHVRAHLPPPPRPTWVRLAHVPGVVLWRPRKTAGRVPDFMERA